MRLQSAAGYVARTASNLRRGTTGPFGCDKEFHSKLCSSTFINVCHLGMDCATDQKELLALNLIQILIIFDQYYTPT